MKKITLVLLSITIFLYSNAQKDTSLTKTNVGTKEKDTIIIGKMRIIFGRKNTSNKYGSNKNDSTKNRIISLGKTNKVPKKTNPASRWFILDFGINNFVDNTNYATAVPSPYLAAGVNANSFKLNGSKSVNVNLWLVMQKYNLYKHYLNFKYGLGFESYNFNYSSNVSYRDQPTRVFNDATSYSKNKLALTYVTIPVMFNFNASPNKKGLRLSAGLSTGYLFSARNKQISAADGKRKNRGDFDLNKIKTSLIGEIGISSVTLYGSYSLQNMHKAKLEHVPYAIGVRLCRF